MHCIFFLRRLDRVLGVRTLIGPWCNDDDEQHEVNDDFYGFSMALNAVAYRLFSFK